MCLKVVKLFAMVLLSIALVEAQSSNKSPDVICANDEVCVKTYGHQSNCDENKCVCWDDNENVHVRCVSKTPSPKVTILGFSCKTNQNCKPERSVCDTENNRCVCPEDYPVEAADKRRCLKGIPSITSACQDTNQCASLVQHTECLNRTCVCEDFFNLHDDHCIAKSSLHGGCFNDGNCKHVENSQCEDRVCTCVNGFVPEMDGVKCLPVTHNIGDSCSEHHQCEFNLGKGSACIEEKCQCREEYYESEDKTHCNNVPSPPQDTDDTWTSYECDNTTKKCELYGLRGHFSCVDGKCKCDDGAKYLQVAYVCHWKDTELHHECTLPLDCSTRYSTCSLNHTCNSEHQDENACTRTCQCVDGRTEQNGKCVKKCDNDNQCAEHEKCVKENSNSEGNCDCPRSHDLDLVEKKCSPISCKLDEDCPKYEGASSEMIKCHNNTCRIDMNNGKHGVVSLGNGKPNGAHGLHFSSIGGASFIFCLVLYKYTFFG